MSNRLKHSSSPYLLQHAENPVDWYPWGEEALNRARKEQKLIFLSIGYSSCHWCHVMERESFEDEETAAFLNKHFISVKVDREERPDIDSLYMEAVQMMTGHGGWPLSVWLTPDQIPVFGGTYFPPRPMHGRPSFMQILQRLLQVWEDDNDTARKRASEIKNALSRDLLDRLGDEGIQEDHFKKAAEHYAQNFDPLHGGFSPAPKFPTAMGISFLIKYAGITGSEEARQQAIYSLKSMIRGGIYDHIGGGFHRYSVDAQWLVPHFEKMLYDNALLLNSLADAIILTGDPIFHDTAREVLAFLNREMRHPSGGYFSALDADSEGEEGKFYTWSRDEVIDALSEFDKADAARFCDTWNITESGNWEGSNIPHLPVPGEEDNPVAEADTALFNKMKNVLLEVREKRIRPGLDDKVITSWNAMLLKSLCRLGRAMQDENIQKNALELAAFLQDKLVKPDGTVHRIFKDGKTSQPGFLDDVALLAEAYTWVFEVTGDSRWLEQADSLCGKLVDEYYDDKKQGFFYTGGGHEQLLTRSRDLFDNAVPSGNSAALSALWRCGLLTGNTEFNRISVQAIEKLIGTASPHASSFGYLLDQALQLFYHDEEVIISGTEPEAFMKYFMDHPSFTRLLVFAEDASKTPYPPFQGKYPVDGKTACYVCSGFSCKKPVTDPGEVSV